MSVRVRFCAGSADRMSIGEARVALWNYLFARHEEGTFVLRVADVAGRQSQSDTARGHKGSAQEAAPVADELRWLGLDWDEGPAPWPGRPVAYARYAERLIEAGRAYRCTSTPAVRLCPPGRGGMAVEDIVLRRQVHDLGALGDVPLFTADGLPTRHMSTVVDDHEAAITHVIRDQARLPDTALELLLYEALGWTPPQYAHLPSIADIAPSTPLETYRGKGYLAPAVANHLARLGWTPRGKRELLSLEALAERFDLQRAAASRPPFAPEQLDWFNRRAVGQLDDTAVTRLMVPYWRVAYGTADRSAGTTYAPVEWQQALALTIRGEVHYLAEAAEAARFAFVDRVEPDAEGARVLSQAYVPEVLRAFAEGIAAVEPFAFQSIDHMVSELRWAFKAAHGIRSRDVMYAIRAALTGRADGPCVIAVCQLLGRRRCADRARAAMAEGFDG